MLLYDLYFILCYLLMLQIFSFYFWWSRRKQSRPQHDISYLLVIVGLDMSRDASTSLSLRSARAGLLDHRGLSLHTAQRNSFNELFLGEEEYKQEWQDADQRTWHQYCEFAAMSHLGLEESQPNR